MSRHVLAGQSPLGEVLACPSAPALDGLAVCLMDVEDGERLRRLDARDPTICGGPAISSIPQAWRRP